ncbi:F-box protein SKIP19-like [Lycium ferocissimum]|uniref:F-box protein SKIP19-like n=1 Tax=Lycium ferocissimum TaxID=112874 RepID=UPI00281628E9|nr:F-box protein SKIP19-like [Lycium ferocissimum]
MNRNGKGRNKNQATANSPPWLELPVEIWAYILHKLGAIEILLRAQNVCTTWRRACKDPSMWRVIDCRVSTSMWHVIHSKRSEYINFDKWHFLVEMCRHAVDRSQGELVDIRLEFYATDELLAYVVERSPKLKSLSFVKWTLKLESKVFVEVVQNLPLLEEVFVSYSPITKENIEALGHYCPRLKLIAMNCSFYMGGYYSDRRTDEALAIAKNLPALHHL